MNENKILDVVINNAKKILQRSLHSYEIIYIKTHIGELTSKNYTKQELCDAFPILMELIITDLQTPSIKNKIISTYDDMDIHEYLKNEIGSKTDMNISNQEKEKENIIAENKQSMDISSLFGTTNTLKILSKINPSALTSKAYLILDRKYQISEMDDNMYFSWALLGNGSHHPNSNTIKITSPLHNIIGIRILPFRFPNTNMGITSTERITVTVKELKTQAYVTSENGYRFHFMFRAQRSDVINSNSMYELTDAGRNSTEFTFYNAIDNINSITINFGNPFEKLILDPDKVTATITPDGVQSILTMTAPHFIALYDTVSITGFNTTNPIDDIFEIELANSEFGFDAAAITSNTITIDLDLSLLDGGPGSIVDTVQVYLESKRFIIPLEILFKRNE
jgi:hypothetical protein